MRKSNLSKRKSFLTEVISNRFSIDNCLYIRLQCYYEYTTMLSIVVSATAGLTQKYFVGSLFIYYGVINKLIL